MSSLGTNYSSVDNLGGASNIRYNTVTLSNDYPSGILVIDLEGGESPRSVTNLRTSGSGTITYIGSAGYYFSTLFFYAVNGLKKNDTISYDSTLNDHSVSILY